MASRRVRIKGIANIPQRKKPVNIVNGTELEEQTEITGNEFDKPFDNSNLNLACNSHVTTSDVINQSRLGISSIEGTIEVQNLYHHKRVVLIPEKRKTKIRRKFLKPPISLNALNRRPKETTYEGRIEPNKENLQEGANINLNEVEISTSNINSPVLIQKVESQLTGTTLGIVKPSLKESAKSGSDTECQQPPPSPTKHLTRRIKAVPRLHQRRTSFSIGSASESEDDTRRTHSRIRNDSVCSTNSAIIECNSTTGAKSPTRKEYTAIQRKYRRTGQSRKFAEARREFNMKFVNGKPDKQKLTMIDLIFYNPATNPMSSNKRKRKSTTSSDVSDTKSKPEEEKIDDPQPASESDNELPAPQIKVGPNGEIVIDEKSLIIENTETKRSREALQMSELVDGDEDTSYGVYKKTKRTKEWTKDETLRFYKALNTIGTDFTMMCELFPNRTRRELKMKFKKEERLNQALVNKAVMQPCEFDMTELRKDLELEERKAEEKKKRIEEAKALKAAHLEQRKILNKSVKIKGIDANPNHFQSTSVIKPPPAKKHKKTAYDVIKKGINSVFSSDSDVDDDLNECTSIHSHHCNDDYNVDQESISNILKPTRYGRVPKARLPETADVDKQKTVRKKKDTDCPSDDNKPAELEPGSIMIVKSKTPGDELVFKVYIVTNNKTKQQIDLAPNVLKNLSEIRENQVDGDVQAHNILTISAQECPNITELSPVNVVSNNETNLELVNKSESYKNSDIKTLDDSIVIPFDECLTPTTGNQNITVSHEDNKMIVVTENNKQCVLTT
ncbi:hypothetical protein Trydic_g5413 [Trypoxylus dichotomus]